MDMTLRKACGYLVACLLVALVGLGAYVTEVPVVSQVGGVAVACAALIALVALIEITRGLLRD